jgi:hypothetical protein
MRFALSALAAVAASLALGPVHSGVALAYAGDLVVPRYLPRPPRARTSSRPAAVTANGPAFLAAAKAKRARKAARRAELAA